MLTAFQLLCTQCSTLLPKFGGLSLLVEIHNHDNVFVVSWQCADIPDAEICIQGYVVCFVMTI